MAVHEDQGERLIKNSEAICPPLRSSGYKMKVPTPCHFGLDDFHILYLLVATLDMGFLSCHGTIIKQVIADLLRS